MDPSTSAPADAGTSSANVNGTTIDTATSQTNTTPPKPAAKPRPRNRRKNQPDAAEGDDDATKRRCVSTACIACRKRKSKCDGNTPACAACSQVYGTECIYDPNSDLRRKGVYKNDVDSLKTRDSTLQTLIQAILNTAEEDVPELVREIRTCESLDVVAERILAKEHGEDVDGYGEDESPTRQQADWGMHGPTFETQLYGKMGDLRLDDGSVRYIGGTSNLIHLAQPNDTPAPMDDDYLLQTSQDPITSWTTVTKDPELINHLLNMYFTWHYTYFTTLSKKLFLEDFHRGKPPAHVRRKNVYCSPLLVNAILALGCHFTSHSGAREDPNDSATAGDHFFREAKRLIMENDEHEKPSLTTVQAFALMSVREAGCGREAKGWIYSGMSFRMACDMGLNLDSSQLTSNREVSGDELEEDARRITFWGCFLFDKCWSNYLGRLPQLPSSIATVSMFEVFPEEDSAQWSPYTDSGFSQAHAQPARTRAVGRQIIKLCEISNDLMKNFYNPIDMEKTKGKAAELRKLSDIHTRLEAWRRELPKELEPKEGGLSHVLVMHMFFQLLFIHLFRPFLKYTQATSPLPATVSPRKLCTHAAAMISKLMRLYKRSHGLRQICNIAVYIAHSACTIHLLNLPDKNAKRDIVHGVKHLEEIAEGWLGARRTLGILSLLARKWQVDLPEEAAAVLARTDQKFGHLQSEMQQSPGQSRRASEGLTQLAVSAWPLPASAVNGDGLWSMNGNTSNTASSSMPQTTAYLSRVSSQAPMPQQQQQSQLSASSENNTFRRPHSSLTQSPESRRQQPQKVATPPMTQPTTAGHSPSAMFGGVEQLIREGQSWTYRDQAQLATGFENWNHVDLDPKAWSSSAASVGAGLTSGHFQQQPQSHAHQNPFPSQSQQQQQQSHMVSNGGPVGGRQVTSGISMSSLPTSYGSGNIPSTAAAAVQQNHHATTTTDDEDMLRGMDFLDAGDMTGGQPGGGAGGNGSANNGLASMSSWLDSMTYSNIRATMYNEDEWYQ